MSLPNWLGIIGGALLLFGYAKQKSLARIPAGLLNLIGAGLVGYNAYMQQAWGPFGLEIAWMGIAALTLLKPSSESARA